MKAEGARAVYWKGKCELCAWAFEVSVPTESHPNKPLFWRCGYYNNRVMADVARDGCTGPKKRETTTKMANCDRCKDPLRDYQWNLRPGKRLIEIVCIKCLYVEKFGKDEGYKKYIAGETAPQDDKP